MKFFLVKILVTQINLKIDLSANVLNFFSVTIIQIKSNPEFIELTQTPRDERIDYSQYITILRCLKNLKYNQTGMKTARLIEKQSINHGNPSNK